jgi:hypothetical protein
MGGWGTWWIGLRHADVFAAICPMSGFPPGEMIRNARNLAPFVIHDSLDDIVPVENSRMPVELLAHFGISHEYREETGYAHSSKLIGDNLPRVFEWFNQHPRVARPKHVAIVSRTPLAGEAYWLKLIGTSAYPKQATLDAFVDTTGNLTIRADGVKKFAVNLDALPTSASEPLKVTLGGGSFVAEKKRGWAVFENDGGASWTLKIGSIELPEPQKPLTGEIIEKLKAAAGNQDKLAEIVASLLMKETGAQACVLDAEKFKLPPGDLTGDMILELSAYPDERLAVFECPASALAKAHEAISKRPINVFPPGTTTKGNVSTRVVMPVAIAKQFPKYDETRNVFPELVGDLLYRVSSK